MSWTRDFVRSSGEALRVSCRSASGGTYTVVVGDASHEVSARRLPDGRVAFEVDGRRHVAAAVRLDDGSVQVRIDGRTYVLPEHKGGRGGAEAAATGEIRAPMTGTVLAVNVEKGQAVSAGDPVAVVTAMKMEHKLAAAIDGTVVEVGVAAGDNVDEGTLIARIE